MRSERPSMACTAAEALEENRRKRYDAIARDARNTVTDARHPPANLREDEDHCKNLSQGVSRLNRSISPTPNALKTCMKAMKKLVLRCNHPATEQGHIDSGGRASQLV